MRLARDRHKYMTPGRSPGAPVLKAKLAVRFPITEPAMPQIAVSPYVLPILMLTASNLFMTFAWYGHLRYKAAPLLLVILVSWGIAFVEYCFAVPANRWGSDVYSAAQLKTIQEVVTLVIFSGFSVLYLHQSLNWNHAVGFAFIALGAFFVFRGPL